MTESGFNRVMGKFLARSLATLGITTSFLKEVRAGRALPARLSPG